LIATVPLDAPDEAAAIAAAIEKFGIADPEWQKRLVAQRVRTQAHRAATSS